MISDFLCIVMKGNFLKQFLIKLTLFYLVTHTAMIEAHGIDEQTAYGVAGSSSKVTRVIKISMGDNFRFDPDNLSIKQGETIKLVIINRGKVLHEIVIGTLKDLQEHAEMMKQMPDMQHNDPNMVRVKPNKKGEIIWTFNKIGHFNFACLQSGHSEVGMVGKITVAK